MDVVRDIEPTSTGPTATQIRIAIYVISLPDSEKRRRVVAEYLSRVGLQWRYFEAVRYNPVSPPGQNPIEVRGEMLPGEVGCFLSHRALWKEIGNSKLDYAIVLEDDTVLIPSVDFPSLFSLLRELDINYIRLTAHQILRAKTLADLGELYGLLSRIICPKHGIGTCSYAVTPKAARQLYGAVARIEQPVDLWIERYANHGVSIYDLLPGTAIEMRAKSTIRLAPSAEKTESFLAYASRKVSLTLSDSLEGWRLSKLDDALRKRADLLYPGMAVWPRFQLRKHCRRLLNLLGQRR
jgi:GR25 family glycosyltransferase involved in LPS biosynthesis